MPPSTQASTDCLSLSHKSTLGVTGNSHFSIKSSPSIRNYHDGTNVTCNSDNKSICSVESLSIIEELKERAKYNKINPNFEFANVKRAKLNEIKKQSLVSGSNVSHPFSLYQKIKLGIIPLKKFKFSCSFFFITVNFSSH